uniref:Leucine-rich repeat-containing protein 15 n=1 Tax=Romanomermis culicivorax TaxID=13658 RepID=A0A915JD66_ROMCU
MPLFFWPFILIFWTSGTGAQCPRTTKAPCHCSATRDGQSAEITCDNARSLHDALVSIGDIQNLRIRTLVLQNTPIRELPDFAFQGYNINRLVLNNNNLLQIRDRAFDGVLQDNLMELDLKNNQLGQIPAQGTLANLKRLKMLILAKNRIAQLPKRPFEQYASKNHLTKIDLSGNQLSRIGQDVFQDLTNLEEISLEANRLEVLPVPLFFDLRLLKNLNLGLNRLSNVPIRSLDFQNLESLSLEFNNLTYLPAECFRSVPKLNYLSLTGNRFQMWDPDMFRYIGNLRILGMGDTSITRIPQNAFQNIRNIIRLEMSESAVAAIDQGAFQQIANVETIVMNKNRLKKINVTTFQLLHKLESLDLSGNLMTEIEDRSFSNLPSLKHLDVSTNDLQLLHPSTFANTFSDNGKNRVLYSCENPWICDIRLSWFRQWLRQNPDIVIDKPPGCMALCKYPSELINWPLRSEDPISLTTEKLPPFTLPTLNEAEVPNTLAWIILAIILAILLFAILLLAIVRYFMSQKRKREKDEEARMVSVANSMRQSSATSTGSNSYPGATASIVDLNLPPATSLYDKDVYI